MKNFRIREPGCQMPDARCVGRQKDGFFGFFAQSQNVANLQALWVPQRSFRTPYRVHLHRAEKCENQAYSLRNSFVEFEFLCSRPPPYHPTTRRGGRFGAAKTCRVRCEYSPVSFLSGHRPLSPLQALKSSSNVCGRHPASCFENLHRH